MTQVETAENAQNNADTVWDEGLSGRIRLFVLHYCTDERCFMCGTRAYKAAYRKKNDDNSVKEVDDNTAAVNAHKLLRKTKVKSAIKKLFKITQTDVDEENVYRVLHDMALLATYNPADIIDARGRLKVKNLADLGDKAKCIQNIFTRISAQGDVYYDVVLVNREKFMKPLAQYLKLVRDVDPDGNRAPIFVLQGQVAEEDFKKMAAQFDNTIAGSKEE